MVSAYGSWILAKSFAAGALEAEAETHYPFDLEPQNVLNLTYWWIIVANAVTYGKDAMLAFMNKIHFAETPDEKAAEKATAEVKKIDFMRITAEIEKIKPKLEEWLKVCNANLQEASLNFKEKFLKEISAKDLEDMDAVEFSRCFETFLKEDILALDSKNLIEAASILPV